MSEIWTLSHRDFGFDVAEAAVATWFFVGRFVDYDPTERRTGLREAETIPIGELSAAHKHLFVCAMTATLLRQALVERVAELTDGGMQPAKVIHPSAVVSDSADAEGGSIVMAGAVLAAGSGLGKFNLVNRGATVGHHTRLDDFCTLGPGVNIGGNCTLGRNTYVGIGATVLNWIRIGANCLVGAGAVVTKDIPDHSLVMGVPARVKQSGFPGR